MALEKGKRLGRGLEALIPGAGAPRRETEPGDGDLRQVRVSQIRPNPYQPRREFEPAELAELEASIKESGLLQPLTVRRSGDAFELIAGERRFRAVSKLGWETVPAIVRELDERSMLTLAMIENLQRADLNAVEEATGYRRLIDEFGLTQQQIGQAIGKDRTTIAGLLRILTLPAPVLSMVEKGLLSTGHAKALLPLASSSDIIAIANETVARHLSVREIENRVRGGSAAEPSAKAQPAATPAAQPDPTVRSLEDALRRRLQTDVKIRLSAPERGHLEIAFYSAEDLDRLLDLIVGADR